MNHFFKRDGFVFPEHDPQLMVAHLLCRSVEPSEVARAATVRFFVALRHVDDDDVFHLSDLGLYRRAAIPSQEIDAAFKSFVSSSPTTVLPSLTPRIIMPPFVFAKAVTSSTMRGAEVLLEFDGKPLSLLNDHVDSLGINHLGILPTLLCVQRPADPKERLDPFPFVAVSPKSARGLVHSVRARANETASATSAILDVDSVAISGPILPLDTVCR